MSDSRYRVFVASVDTGSMTRAAELLGYSQSGVSHLIEALEDELGFQLLLRGKTGISLTQEGAAILPYIRSLIQSADTVNEVAEEITGVRSGTLRIGTFPSFAIERLPQILSQYTSKYPDIDIKIVNGEYKEIETALAARSLDCAFVPLPTRPEFKTTFLMEDRYMAVLPEGHRLAVRSSVSVADVAGEDFILPSDSYDPRNEKTFSTNEYEFNIRFAVSDDLVAFGMVRQGLGYTIFPKLMVDFLPKEGIVSVPIENTVRRIGLARVAKNDPSPALRAFSKLCAAQFGV